MYALETQLRRYITNFLRPGLCKSFGMFLKKERNKYEELYNTKVREFIPIATQRSGERSRTPRKTMIEAQEPIRSTSDTGYK